MSTLIKKLQHEAASHIQSKDVLQIQATLAVAEQLEAANLLTMIQQLDDASKAYTDTEAYTSAEYDAAMAQFMKVGSKMKARVEEIMGAL